MREQVERFFQLSLLGLVASGYLAVAGSGFLDTPTVALVAAGLLLRGLLVAGLVKWEPSIAAINTVTLAYIAFFGVDYFFLSQGLLEATVHLVCFLAVLKILTARTNRDYLYTATIALLELLVAALLSTQLNFFAFLALYLLFAIATFTSAEMRRALQNGGAVARVAKVRFAPRLATLTGVVTAGILVMTAGLFFFLPRTANAAFRHLLASRYHLSGFSNEVTLGQVGEVQKDPRPVMHVRSYAAPIPPGLKWRGAALSHFDGKRWTEAGGGAEAIVLSNGIGTVADDRQRRRTDGIHLLYRVDLTSSDTDALFIAGIPEFVNVGHARLRRTATDGFRVGASLADSVRYEVSSFVPGTAYAAAVPKYADLGPAARARYLQLPELDARIAGLAREYAGQGSELGRALALQNRLKTSYGYTLEFPSTAVADPLANFLFTRKQGHCEYFASSMAIMLRTLGIPARIVNGFQSGRFNPMSGLYVIRASDAHSWVEAFLPGEGWVTFDPTPAAERTTADSWNTQMALFFDAADTFWQDWVVHYDLGHQITLAERLEEGTRRLRWEWGGGRPVNWGAWKSNAARGLKRWAAPAIALALAVVLLVWGRGRLGRYRLRQRSRKGRVSPKDATLLYERMLRVMRRKGFQKPPWFTPGEFAATLPASPAGELVARFTASYHAVRFGGDAASVRELGSLIEQLERL